MQTLNNMYHRWTPEMETEFLKQHHWRKSSQWVTLRCAPWRLHPGIQLYAGPARLLHLFQQQQSRITVPSVTLQHLQ